MVARVLPVSDGKFNVYTTQRLFVFRGTAPVLSSEVYGLCMKISPCGEPFARHRLKFFTIHFDAPLSVFQTKTSIQSIGINHGSASRLLPVPHHGAAALCEGLIHSAGATTARACLAVS